MPAQPRTWHPMLQAREYEPGRWVMFDSLDKPYALVAFLQLGDQWGYRVVTWRQESADRKLIGYYTNFAAATSSVHGLWVGRHTPSAEGMESRNVDPWG